MTIVRGPPSVLSELQPSEDPVNVKEEAEVSDDVRPVEPKPDTTVVGSGFEDKLDVDDMKPPKKPIRNVTIQDDVQIIEAPASQSSENRNLKRNFPKLKLDKISKPKRVKIEPKSEPGV